MSPRSSALSLFLFLPMVACSAYEDDAKHEVVITSAGNTKIQAIKVVRQVTGLGLAEAKQVVDSVPSTIASNLSMAEARELASKLQEAGMAVEIR